MPEEEKEKEQEASSKSQTLANELKDIPKGQEVSFIVVYRDYDPDSGSVQNKQRSFVIKDFGTSKEKVYHIQQSPQRRVMPAQGMR